MKSTSTGRKWALGKCGSAAGDKKSRPHLALVLLVCLSSVPLALIRCSHLELQVVGGVSLCINWVNRNVKGIKTCAMLSMGLPFTYRADAGWLPLPRGCSPWGAQRRTPKVSVGKELGFDSGWGPPNKKRAG